MRNIPHTWTDVTCLGHVQAFASKTCVVFIERGAFKVVATDADDGELITTHDWQLVLAYMQRRDAYASRRMNTTQGS